MRMTAPTAALSLFANASLASALWAQAPRTIEFNREVRPILSDRCFTCHGPDPAKRKSKLRFDSEAGAMQDLGGHFAIVPGDPSKSELIRRITTDKKGLRMPPVYAGNALSPSEVETLRRWVEQGAKWQNHWSLIPPRRPELPPVENAAWPRNPIDRFILARLEREGLKPSREADRATLIRRVSLDITGLPPTPAEVEAFLKDESPDAYEKVVDRLLESPRYGERMAARWLDAARYADTNGYQTDGERVMWRWRDWVIDAFNRNMPFDQFTVEQLAGDLLPNPTIEQRIATGFNRNHRGNGEGGIIPEEYAVEYVIDRVETTSTMWLGLTMGCTRCHDHKYDPILQKDFYRMYAFFNNIPERGRAWKYGNSPPTIPAPTKEQQAQVHRLEEKLGAAEKSYADLRPEIERSQKAWEKSFRKMKKPVDGSIGEDLVVHFGLEGETPNLKAKDGAPRFTAGKIGTAANFDGKHYFDIGGGVAKFGFYDKFSISAWIYPAADTGVIVSKGEDTPEPNGYGFVLNNGKLQVNLVTRWLDDALRVETEQPVALNQWQHVAMSYDGGRVADGVRIYVNGEPRKLKVQIDDLNQTFETEEPLRVGGGYGTENRFRGTIDEVRIFNVPLKPEDVVLLASATPVTAIAKIKPEKRQPADSAKLARYFITNVAPEPQRQAYREAVDLRRKLQAMIEGFPTVMVMQELPEMRQAHVLIRGAYDRPGEKVDRGVPGALPPMSPDLPRNRLGLAKWLVDPGNPLPARVFMNRLWQQYFGIGIVRTVEDFGSQGEWPVHPELLDWLATEFVAKQWNIKAMVKTIATSAAYRQSSGATQELTQRDPENRLLARGPRFRMPAEIVRDQALAVSGLLVEKVGGPSVKPYQPAGLWKELAGGTDYSQDQGDALYRRSLYTFWKRTVPPPTMTAFDAAGRETCIVRESRTNTPLQALTLMNDPTFVEASRALGQRMMTEGGAKPDERIAYGYRLATARVLPERMGRILHDSFYYSLDRYQTNRDSAQKLVAVGESKRNEQLNVSELAAYTTVASLILNMDQTVTKE
ncbi:MAG: DUF1553 domain-containing protein [Bryobacteraceae bacterium]